MKPPFDVLAPGKLVMVGEYAVLDGGPAVVIAIDRGVRCAVREGEGVSTPDGDLRYVSPALLGAPQARYVFSAYNPVDLPEKPGFGGSAAACVAACLAAGRPGADAFVIHRQVQGDGSGVDVAASLHGGQIRFEAGEVQHQQAVTPMIIWSGRSAGTAQRILRYRALSVFDRREFAARMSDLVNAYPADPVAALRQAGALLESMAARAGLDYLTPTLARIRDIAAQFGGAAKPSGAGGGDCAVALFPDNTAEEDFQASLAREGLIHIAATVSPGARIRPAAGLSEP